MTLTAAQKRIVHARETSEVALHLLTLSHADLDTLRLVADDVAVTSNGNEFAPTWFEWRRPTEGPVSPRGRLRALNVDGVQADMINAVKTPISVKMEVVFASDPDTVVQAWPHYRYVNVTYDAAVAEGDLAQPDYGREMWPPRVHNEADIPGANW